MGRLSAMHISRPDAKLASLRTRHRILAVFSTISSTAILLLLRLLRRWWIERRLRASKYCLCLTSSLEGSAVKLAYPQWYHWEGWEEWHRKNICDRWRGACPSCKRPIDIYASKPWGAKHLAQEARGNYAFVITLWGTSTDYVLGALVLGHSIKRTGSVHARVCLHTDDVPPEHIALLSKLWDCRVMQHVEACTEKLSFQEEGKPHRFDKVFTKLRVMELTDFEKVLMMDIDLVVTDNIDELFDLRPPAALRRGMNDKKWALRTGEAIDGRSFFLGRGNDKWSWGQGTGINAGVMLLQPDKDVFAEMLAEIQDPKHPEHTQGNGPEQDYLSRFWADAPWSYIGVEYNYQLHQMFFALHPKWADCAERADFLRDPKRIKIVHFSGVPTAKPWHRVLDSRFSEFWPDRTKDAEYTTMFADEFLGHWLWIRRDPQTWKNKYGCSSRTEMDALFLGDDGEIYEKSWEEGGQPSRLDLPAEVTDGAMKFLHSALGTWFDCYEALESDFGFGLRDRLRANASPDLLQPAMTLAARSNFNRFAPENFPTVDSGGSSRTLSTWRKPDGWWTEQTQNDDKLSVVCGGVNGRSFVSFCEGGVETFGEYDELDLTGIFVKVVGNHTARHFAVACPDGDARMLEEAIGPIRFWVDCVPVGSAVLLAIIGLEIEKIKALLSALAPLGVSQEFPCAPLKYRALAAVGVRPVPGDTTSEKRSGYNSKARDSNSTWQSCHASTDIAYASMPFNVT